MTEVLTFEEHDVQEEFFARGWTDGLPIVAPTPERVQMMVDLVGGDALIGYLAARSRGVTIEQAAINAVMAGCRPDYFPVVVAALEAMFDPAFNLHTVLTSTGGAALCVIVSGPIADEIGMNARHNVLGPGNRANATIGRALRLVAMNVLGSKPGESDASSFGHPGKLTLCFAEDPPPSPWEPLRVELGYDEADTTVTVVPTEGPLQLAQQLTDSAADVLRSFGRSIGHPTWFSTGKGGHGALVLGPEHARFCVDAGLSRADVRERIYAAARVDAEELVASGVHLEQGAQHDMTPAEDGTLPSLRSPDDVAAGHRRRRGRGLVGLAWSLGTGPARLSREPPGPPGRRTTAGLRPGRVLAPMGMIRVLRPDVTDAPPAAVALAPRRELPERPVIGLIPNGKPLARELLEILAHEIDPRFEIVWLQKPAASAVISAEEAKVMAVRAHVVISGLGD